MAIDYTDLFTDVGKMLKYINVYNGYAADAGIYTHFQAIAATLTANDRFDILSGLPEQYSGFRDGAIGWSNTLAARIESRFLHFSTVGDELPLPSSYSTIDVMRELIRDMNLNTQDVDASSVTIGSATAGSGNVGDAQILTTKIMDGYSAPRRGMLAHPAYKDLNSEVACTAETMTLVCTSDSYSGTNEGREQFSLAGSSVGNSPFDWRVEGSGAGDSLSVGNGRGIISNGEFENFSTANIPDNWDVDAGVIGTHIAKGTTGLKRGESHLIMLGDGALATIQVSQTITSGAVNPLRSYCVGMWVKCLAGTLAGTFVAQFEGTGYTAGATEKLSVAFNTLSTYTSWTYLHFFVNIPANIPADFELVLKTTGTLTLNKYVRIDGVMLTEVVWHGGVGFAIGAGATPIVKGDRFTVALSNNNAGTFQTFMRKKFNVQLPSDTGGTETIADSLAE
jgi:hypothetical protein